MQIQVDEQGRILGYATVGGFEGGLEIDAGEEIFEEFAPGMYVWQDGAIALNPDYAPEEEAELERDPVEILSETVDMLVISALGGEQDV